MKSPVQCAPCIWLKPVSASVLARRRPSGRDAVNSPLSSQSLQGLHKASLGWDPNGGPGDTVSALRCQIGSPQPAAPGLAPLLVLAHQCASTQTALARWRASARGLLVLAQHPSA